MLLVYSANFKQPYFIDTDTSHIVPCRSCLDLHLASGHTTPPAGLTQVGTYLTVEFYECPACEARLIRAPIDDWQVLEVEEHESRMLRLSLDWNKEKKQ
jgi:hypothetical protein